MTSFKVSVQDYDHKFPRFLEPSITGHYSINGEREFLDSDTHIKYYCPPSNPKHVFMDLKKGKATTSEKDSLLEEKLDNILQWILLHKHEAIEENKQRISADFICYRGHMTLLFCTPYENREDWKVAAIKFQHSIYLCPFRTDAKRKEILNQTERQREMGHWGYKFEQHLMSDSPNGKPNTEAPLNENEEFSCVFRSRIADHMLLYAAEVDGVADPIKGLKANNLVELKTSRLIENPNQDRNFKRFKLVKWWAQSYLAGIPRIICGFRDDDGVVRKIEEYETLKLHHIAQGLWQPNVCMNFCAHFFTFVKSVMKESNKDMVYVFSWRPKEDVTYWTEGRDSPYYFLPEWYMEEIFKYN
ncbi:unnamed protein product [Darwinula stevensoni]|uniref:Decapping nuclease n=1 Tax=Darwinula stevensoni TaxID=69355 RepID=A0A7R8XG94_9CRUS|nr:unnamed protein product [Darwinula stevensoni]CAG0889494.1 unnamed protein product [Darwinula stevensoni]